MKNVLNGAFAILMLALVTSCQKENLTPQTGYDSTVYSPSNSNGSMNGSSAGYSGTTVEVWNFCEQDMTVTKSSSSTTQAQQIKLYDANKTMKFGGDGVDQTAIPQGVKDMMATTFPGMSAIAYWKSWHPATDQYIVEFEGNPGPIVLADKDGHIMCKGSAQ